MGGTALGRCAIGATHSRAIGYVLMAYAVMALVMAYAVMALVMAYAVMDLVMAYAVMAYIVMAQPTPVSSAM